VVVVSSIHPSIPCACDDEGLIGKEEEEEGGRRIYLVWFPPTSIQSSTRKKERIGNYREEKRQFTIYGSA